MSHCLSTTSLLPLCTTTQALPLPPPEQKSVIVHAINYVSTAQVKAEHKQKKEEVRVNAHKQRANEAKWKCACLSVLWSSVAALQILCFPSLIHSQNISRLIIENYNNEVREAKKKEMKANEWQPERTAVTLMYDNYAALAERIGKNKNLQQKAAKEPEQIVPNASVEEV